MLMYYIMKIHNKYSLEKEQKIIEHYLLGKTPTEIAKLFNTYNTTIRRILLRNNFILKSPSETQAIVQINPFENLSNREVQYWLGMLISDGNISNPTKNKPKYTVDLSLSSTDKEHLNKYIKFINYDIKLKSNYNKKYNSVMYSVRFGSKRIHKFLNDLGITPNKSKTINLNIDITWDILRGILDGDGHIKTLPNNRASIEIATASEFLFDQIKKFLLQNSIHCTSSFITIGIIRICTQQDVINVAKSLYKKTDLYLDRKRKKLGPVIEKSITEHTTNSAKPQQVVLEATPS